MTRIITNRSYDAPAKPLIKELKWLTAKEMIRCDTVTMLLKSVNNLAPDYLSHSFIRNSDRNTINIQNAETKLLVPFTKNNNGQKFHFIFFFHFKLIYTGQQFRVNIHPLYNWLCA